MTEVLESAFAVQKRGDRWCLFHRESGIMHERNFSHKGMAKAFGLELTEQGYVPEGAARVAAMVADEPPPEGPVAGEGETPRSARRLALIPICHTTTMNCSYSTLFGAIAKPRARIIARNSARPS